MIPPTTRSTGPWLDATHAASLQRIANRPIVCHVLDALSAAGLEQIAVVTPAGLVEEIETSIENDGRHGSGLRYLAYDPQADPEGSVRSIARFADGAPTILHRSDGLLGQPLGPFLALLRDERSDIVLLVTQGGRNTERLGRATQRMLDVTEFDPANAGFGMVGVCVLGPGALGTVASGEACPGPHAVGAIADLLLADGSARPQVRVVREWRAFSGDAMDLLDMNRVALDGLEYPSSPGVQQDGNRFEGRVSIHPTASVTSSVICGPAIVGACARVVDSYIGPHTSIGERVHMEGAEIERSIVFAGASITHVAGRMVGSVVGREARVFRDFSIPRAMRLQVGDGDEVALC